MEVFLIKKKSSKIVDYPTHIDRAKMFKLLKISCNWTDSIL